MNSPTSNVTSDADVHGGGRPLVLAVNPLLELAILLGSIGVLGAVSLLRAPAVLVDEAWNASRAWGLLQTGRAFGSLDAGVFDRIEGYWTYFPWLGTALHALAIWALGPELLSVRFLSLLFGLGLLIALYIIARRLYSHRVGLLAVLLLSFSPAYLYSSHLGRHDIVAAALGYGAVALYLGDRSPTLSFKSLLSGLAVGLTLDIHPYGILYAPAIVALFLLDDGLLVLRVKRFWGFAAGVTAGAFYFVTVHFLSYPDAYFAITGLCFGDRRTPPLLALDPAVWQDSLVETVLLLMRSGDLLAPLFVFAFASLAFRGSPADRKALALFGVLFLGFVSLIRYKVFFLQYGILVLPAASLLLAACLARLFGDWRGAVARHNLRLRLLLGCLLVLVLGTISGSLIRSLTPLRADAMDEYQATVGRLQRVIPAGSAVMAAPSYWFGLRDHPYVNWDQLVYYQRYAPGSTLEDAFRAFRPDYLIVDKEVGYHVADDRTQLWGFTQFLAISRSELERFLDGRASLVATIQSDDYGPLRVYMLNWGQ